MGRTLDEGETFDCSAMESLLWWDHVELRKEVMEMMKGDPALFFPRHDLDMRQHRDLLMKRWDRLNELGYFKNTITSSDPQRYLARLAVTEICEMLDHSLSVKMGVHYGLFGSAVRGLGVPEQYKFWLPKAESREIIGCFGLSELGAGSNVRGIRTEALYDVAQQCFVLNTPDDAAQKYWIGGAAESASYCSVFANLIVDGVNHGIHCFVVQLRDSSGMVMPGVTIGDCGHKWGLNGVDNGRIWFSNVKVPREDMLRQFSRVTADGQFQTDLPSADERFAKMLGALTGGRVSIIFSGVNGIKIGTTVAVKYAQSREVFGAQLMDVQTHRLRLIPYICSAIVMNCVGNRLKEAFYSRNMNVTKEIHIMSSGLKALSTWTMAKCLQECREACGGQGMLSENRVGPLLSEFNVAMTFEGDNHVLIQQVSKAVVAECQSSMKVGRFTGGLEFMNNKLPPVPLKANSVEFVLQAMRRRVALLLTRLLKSAGDLGKDPRNSVQGNLVLFEEIGVAYTEQLICEEFAKVINDVALPISIRKFLEKNCIIYGLYRIDRQTEFVRSEAISPPESWKVRETLLAECKTFAESGMMDNAIESFGLPDFLTAPIIGDWIGHNAKARL